MPADQDFLTRLDAAVGCMNCERPLSENAVSDYFCSETCSLCWASDRTTYHADYIDDTERWSPDDLADLEPVGWIRPPVWRLPRSTGDLEADKAAVDHALELATTQDQRSACRLRLESLRERRWALWARDWRLPRSTSNFRADDLACSEAERTATTDAQRAACKLRRESLTERRPTWFSFPGYDPRSLAGFRASLPDLDPTSPTYVHGPYGHGPGLMSRSEAREAAGLDWRILTPSPLVHSRITWSGYNPPPRRPAMSEGDTVTIITASSISGRYVVEGYNPDGSMRCRRVPDRVPLGEWTGQGHDTCAEALDEAAAPVEPEPPRTPRERALEARRNRNTGPVPRPGRVRGNVPGARR